MTQLNYAPLRIWWPPSLTGAETQGKGTSYTVDVDLGRMELKMSERKRGSKLYRIQRPCRAIEFMEEEQMLIIVLISFNLNFIEFILINFFISFDQLI